MENKTNIIAVVGPTASGKSALAAQVAKLFGGEILSCDSMQVYRGMDIGTAKVTEKEKQGVPHHLIDIADPTENFSCADYAKAAKKVIGEVSSKGKIPVFCGGTGLYLESAVRIDSFSAAPADPELRKNLESRDPGELYRLLSETDPEAAMKTHANNVKRVVRALEIYMLTGKTKTQWDRESVQAESPYRVLKIFLDFNDRSILYDRIDRRAEEMFGKGLVEEVRGLDSEAFRSSTASDGIGYKEVLMYLDGKITLEEAVEAVKKASRNYAKRHLTWFRADKNAHRIFVDFVPENIGGADKFKFIVNSATNIINNFLNMLY